MKILYIILFFLSFTGYSQTELLVNGNKHVSSYVQKGTYGSTAASTSHTFNYSTTPVSGHALFLFVYITASATLTTPSGWTLDNTSTAGTDHLYVLRKTAGASEPTAVTLAVSASSALTAIGLEWVGFTTSDDNTTGSVNENTTPALTMSGTNVTTAPDLMFTINGYTDNAIGSTGPWSYNNGYVQIAFANNTATLKYELVIGYKISSSTGSNSVTITATNTSVSTGLWIYKSYH